MCNTRMLNCQKIFDFKSLISLFISFKKPSPRLGPQISEKKTPPRQRVETRKREMFSQKSVRRFVGDSSAFVMIRHGRHVVSQCPKQKHFPPVLVNTF